jgi:histidinol-phosphate aminotransferase
MSVLDLARRELRDMQAYSSARMEASGGDVLLNANESAWQPVGDRRLNLNRYPDPQPQALIERLAALYNVSPTQLLSGRGSDEAIDLLVRAFCRAGSDAILISPPTFGMYAVSARIQDAGVIEVPLDADFSLDPDRLLAAVTPRTKLVFVCSPNNPTGGLVDRAVLATLATALRDRALLVVDEAYIEFAGSPGAASLLEEFDNLCVLRTLSKAWALAGARIGSLLAHPEVIALVRRIMPPYPLPSPCVKAALDALSDDGVAQAASRVAVVQSERERLATTLSACPGVLAVIPSRANFLAVRFADPEAVFRQLLARGIVVRDVRRYRGLDDALRITIGAPEENEQVVAAIRAGQDVTA